MKKGNLAWIGLILSSTVFAQHGPFTGFHAGIDIGHAQSDVQDTYNTHIGVAGALNLNLTSTPSKVTDTALLGGVTLGYSLFVDPMFVFGVEARAHFQDLDSIVDHEHIEANSDFRAVTNTSIEMDQDFALLAKLGMVLDNKCLMYVLAGADWGKMDIETSATYHQTLGATASGALSAKESSYEVGYTLGLGIEYLVLENLSVGLEYNYTVFGNLDFTSPISRQIALNGVPQADSIFSSTNVIEMNVSKALLKFNYYFC